MAHRLSQVVAVALGVASGYYVWNPSVQDFLAKTKADREAKEKREREAKGEEREEGEGFQRKEEVWSDEETPTGGRNK